MVNWQSLPCSNHARPACSRHGPSCWLHTHAASPCSTWIASRSMTNLSSDRGWAGHPDLVGWAAAVLKMTTVGWDSLRAATHDGRIEFMPWGNEWTVQLLHLLYSAWFFTQCQVLYSRLQPCPHYVQDSSVHELSPVESCTFAQSWPDLLLRYLSAACEQQTERAE